MANQNAPGKHEIWKIEIPPASFQPSEVKVPESYPARYLNFYRWENYKPGVMSVLSKGTASPNSQPSGSPTTSWCQTKRKSVRRDLFTLEKRNMMRRCVSFRRYHTDGCPWSVVTLLDCSQTLQQACVTVRNCISVVLIPGERHLWKTQITECYQWRKVLPKSISLWEKRTREWQA